MSNLLIAIDEQTAIKIATRFLEQHHSVIVSDATLQLDWWLVTVRVGFLPEQIKKVRVDVKSGKIMDCI
jgi:hypothetical protein